MNMHEHDFRYRMRLQIRQQCAEFLSFILKGARLTTFSIILSDISY